jgi:XTP/dITP diphosphohydrolase
MTSGPEMKTGSGTLVLATGNRGKVLEFQNLLAPAGFILLTPKEIGFEDEVDETGDTFVKNALIKARALARYTAHAILADDSGLEVDALGGAPGVYSARYADRAGDMAHFPLTDSVTGLAIAQDVRNRKKLMQALAGRQDRSARFRCVLCYLQPDQEPRFFAGACEGRIAEVESGDGGFGYDPIFIPAGFKQTFGELSHVVKDEMSHRGQATAQFLKSLS